MSLHLGSSELYSEGVSDVLAASDLSTQEVQLLPHPPKTYLSLYT